VFLAVIKRFVVALGCAAFFSAAFAQTNDVRSANVTDETLEPNAPNARTAVPTVRVPNANGLTPEQEAAVAARFGAPGANAAGLTGRRTGSPADTTPDARQDTVASQPVPALVVPNAFAQFIAESLGRPLPVYGTSLFQRPPSTFSPVESAAVTPEYQIGPGDELIVRVWGPIEIDAVVTVDRNGSIVLPKAGEFRVAGVQYRDLASHLKTALSRVYRNFDLSVTLGRLMPVTVYVVGEARRPGRFNLSSQSTLINAIFAVGGPSEQGSLRSVKLMRGDQVIADLDVYRFIAKGDRSGDMRLAAGDMIVFEKVGPQVAIAGAVNRPAIYELKSATLSAGEALELAGGLTNTATDINATLERIEARKTRKVEDLALQGEDLKTPLRDGDLLRVFPIKPKFENAITVRGNVAMPLRHPWREGVRVSDVIPSKDELITPAYWKTKNNLVVTETKSGEQLKNDIKRNLPEINWSYAVIERIGPDLRPKLIPFNLQKAIVDKDPAHNLELVPGDAITVFSKNDIAVPQKERTVYVTLSGEFKVPGVYQLHPGETLREAIARAGGVTEHAYILGTSLQRESIREEQQRRIDEIMDKMEADMRASNAQLAGQAAGAEGRAFLQSQIAFQEKALRAFRGTAVNGRLYLGLPRKIDLSIADLPDVPLEDGDRIHLPNMQNVVNVFGAVGFQNTQLYAPSRSVGNYIETAGGLARRAESDDVMVLSVDGAAHKRDRSWWTFWSGDVAVMPGDSIFVPEKIDNIPFVTQLKDWTQVLYQMGLGAAAIKTLRD
jgi:polysaccharide biosynthesis/export protein